MSRAPRTAAPPGTGHPPPAPEAPPTPKAPATTTDQDRHEQIVEALHNGEKRGTVAARFGLTAGQVRSIHKSACGADCPHKTQPAPPRPEAEPLPEPPPLRVVAANERDEPDHEPTYWEMFPAWGDYPDPPPPLLTRDDDHPLIPGEGHVEILGAWGSGKSWLAQRATVEALHAGRRTVYLRLEGHQRGLHHRLRMLGLTDDVIRDPDRFRSVTLDYLFEHREWSEHWLTEGVLIIDTVSRAGGSTNDADEAEMWLSSNVTRFTDRACLVVAVDHVAKHFADDLVAISSRGSSAKSAAADFALHVVGHRKHGKRPVSTCWGPDRGGYVHLYIAKPDRHGHIDADGPHGAIATVRGGYDLATGAFRLDIGPHAQTDDPATGDPADPTGPILAVCAATDGLTTRQIIARVHKPGVFTKTAIQDTLLVAVELALITREDGPRNSLKHSITETGRSLLP